MKLARTRFRPRAIMCGAAALAILSLAWSTHEITAYVDEGPYGLSVALAGDIGWLAVLRAEYRHTAVLGRRWIAPAVGWAIALGVAALLVAQGAAESSTAKMVAGPFLLLVGKTVWALTLAELRDPAALTPEQEAEIAAVMRDSAYEARLHAARLDEFDRAADAQIARIRAEARITRARDEADAEIVLERIEQRRAIERRTPIAIEPQSTTDQPPIIPLVDPPLTSANIDREQPSISDLAREQVAITASNAEATRAVLALRPDAKPESVAAAVRRARSIMKGGYA